MAGRCCPTCRRISSVFSRAFIDIYMSAFFAFCRKCCRIVCFREHMRHKKGVHISLHCMCMWESSLLWSEKFLSRKLGLQTVCVRSFLGEGFVHTILAEKYSPVVVRGNQSTFCPFPRLWGSKCLDTCHVSNFGILSKYCRVFRTCGEMTGIKTFQNPMDREIAIFPIRSWDRFPTLNTTRASTRKLQTPRHLL